MLEATTHALMLCCHCELLDCASTNLHFSDIHELVRTFFADKDYSIRERIFHYPKRKQEAGMMMLTLSTGAKIPQFGLGTWMVGLVVCV